MQCPLCPHDIPQCSHVTSQSAVSRVQCPPDIPQCSVQCRADLAAGGYIDSIRGVFLEHCLQQPQPWQRRQPGEDCWLYNCPPANVSFAYMAGHVYILYTLWSIIASVQNASSNSDPLLPLYTPS